MPYSIRLDGLALACMTAVAGPAMAQQDENLCSQQAYAAGLQYQQKSAEVAALQRQGFALATAQLRQKLDEQGDHSNLAIATDLDETVIDNTALLVRDMQKCHDYTAWDTWSHWEQEGNPPLIPGAKDFLDFADSSGVTIYYISDRFAENKAATIETLKALGLPQVSEDSVMLYGPTKEERRTKAGENHELVMLLGDSLADFADVFDDASLDAQRSAVENNADKFGTEWIVFPNSAYGDWDAAELDAWKADMKIAE